MGRTKPFFIALGMVSVAAAACARVDGKLASATATTYVRADTDATRVISPSVRAVGRVADHGRVEGAYTMDAWSGASIDVRTSASQAIDERRHQLDLAGAYEGASVTFGAAYRGSFEPDYIANGGALMVLGRMNGGNTELQADLAGSAERVGRVGDPRFWLDQHRASGRLTVLQVLDARSWLQASWETGFIGGFQSSPYRFVGVGGGLCSSAAPLCLPEHVPDARVRNAATVRARRAFGDHTSVGAGYRFYFDSWSLRSSTFEADVAWLVGAHGTLELRYRYYTQSDAEFYRAVYDSLAQTGGYITRDRKLSAFYDNALALGYLHAFERDPGEPVFVLGLRANGTLFRYLDFIGLERVFALETTASIGLRFE